MPNTIMASYNLHRIRPDGRCNICVFMGLVYTPEKMQFDSVNFAFFSMGVRSVRNSTADAWSRLSFSFK